jgi:hypothetical protein
LRKQLGNAARGHKGLANGREAAKAQSQIAFHAQATQNGTPQMRSLSRLSNTAETESILRPRSISSENWAFFGGQVSSVKAKASNCWGLKSLRQMRLPQSRVPLSLFCNGRRTGAACTQ